MAAPGAAARARVALLGVCVGLALLPFFHSDRDLLSSDWTAFATGAALATGPHPERLYDRAAQQAAQDRITGGGGFTLKGQGRLLPFLSPPWVALLAAPFLALGLGWGARLFVLAQVAALLGGAAAARRSLWAALPVASGFPALVLVLNAQLDGLLVLGVGLAVAAERRGRPVAAGLGLGLTLAKPHLVIPLACAALLTRRWRLLAGWLLAGLGLVALVSLRDGGWMADWLRATAATVGRNGRELDPATWAWALGLPARQAALVTAAISLAALAVVLLVAARRARAGREAGLAVLVAGGVLVAPHALPSDLTLAALALALAGGARPWEWVLLSVLACAAAMAPEPWPPLIALALVGALLARPPGGIRSRRAPRGVASANARDDGAHGRPPHDLRLGPDRRRGA